MALIDVSYFFGELLVANATVAGGPVGEELQLYIDKYEKQFLRYTLGHDLAAAFAAGLLVTPPIEQRWTDLLDGVEFTDQSGRGYTWRGLKPPIDGTSKQSPIAMYVYFFYQKNLYTQSAGVGEVTTKNENAVKANPGEKMARAWNEMSSWIRDLVWYMNNKRDVYPEWQTNLLWNMQRNFLPVNTLF